MQRYIRAFIQAIRITLRGEKPAQDTQLAQLQRWTAQLERHTANLEQAVAQHKLDPATVVTRIDKRNMSLKMLLDVLKFRVTAEYPNLLREGSKSGWSVIYTTNVNDQYYVSRLYDLLPASPVKEQLAVVQGHLAQIPLNLSDF